MLVTVVSQLRTSCMNNVLTRACGIYTPNMLKHYITTGPKEKQIFSYWLRNGFCRGKIEGVLVGIFIREKK